jgi:hypothetical protein
MPQQVEIVGASVVAGLHRQATDTAVDVRAMVPARPSDVGLEDSRLLCYLSPSGQATLLVADPAADTWREVVGAPY